MPDMKELDRIAAEHGLIVLKMQPKALVRLSMAGKAVL